MSKVNPVVNHLLRAFLIVLFVLGLTLPAYPQSRGLLTGQAVAVGIYGDVHIEVADDYVDPVGYKTEDHQNFLYCSGFVGYSVGHTEVIVTAAHCLLPEREWNHTAHGDELVETTTLTPRHIAFSDGEIGVVSRFYASHKYDIGIIVASVVQAHHTAFLSTTWEMGESVWVFGNPKGFASSVVPATALQGDHPTIPENDAPWQADYTLACPGCAPGISGGPVIDESGRVAGILVAGNGQYAMMEPAKHIVDELRAFHLQARELMRGTK